MIFRNMGLHEFEWRSLFFVGKVVLAPVKSFQTQGVNSVDSHLPRLHALQTVVSSEILLFLL